MSEGKFQLEAFFSGRVQGVGLRYQTLQVAKEYDVAGEVCNLSDGRVRLLAEGKEEEVMAFLAGIQEQMASFIRDTEVHTTRGPSRYKGFTIV